MDRPYAWEIQQDGLNKRTLIMRYLPLLESLDTRVLPGHAIPSVPVVVLPHPGALVGSLPGHALTVATTKNQVFPAPTGADTEPVFPFNTPGSASDLFIPDYPR